MQANHDPIKNLARQYRAAIDPTPAHVEYAQARLMERIAAEAQAGPPPPRRVHRLLLVGAVAAGVLLVWGALRAYIDMRVQQTVDASLAARQGAAPDASGRAILNSDPAPSFVAHPATAPAASENETEAPGPASPPETPAPSAGPVASPGGARAVREPAPIDADELLRESGLLSQAREAQARGDWAGVLELVDEHKKSHPRGGLLEERLVLEAAAACSAGLRPRAQKAAQMLRRKFPGSLALTRVADLCNETDDD